MKNVMQTPSQLLALCAALLLIAARLSAQNSCNDLVATFFWSPIPADPRYVQFQDQSTFPNGQITSWLWDFGDGKTSAEQNPTHNYGSFGTRKVCLTLKGTAANGQICEQQICLNVRVEECQQDCDWTIKYSLEATALQASLVVNTPNTFPLESVRWTLEGGNLPSIVTGEGYHFSYLFAQPGRYTLCARYAQFDGSVCTECRAFEVLSPCVEPALIDPNAVCPAVFEPVCGCDGKTYDNFCVAQKKAGLTSWSPGACGSPCNAFSLDFQGFNSGGALTVYTFNGEAALPLGSTVTSWFWDFGNGQTSTLQSPSLNFFTPGNYVICLTANAQIGGTSCSVTTCKVFRVGKLCFDQSGIDPNAVCPVVYDPVCGCDGQTYENACIAQKRYGITEWVPGRCSGDCFDPALVDTTLFCTTEYDPVCGCDGETYSNACQAFLRGITDWRRGRCCPDGTCRAFFEVQVLPDRQVLLSDLSVQAESWHLDFGDGSTHGGFFDSLVHTYATDGLYQICLNISNFAGSCSDKYCRTVDLSKVIVEEPGEQFSLTVLPNPAHERARVQVLGSMPRHAALWDVLGKNVWQQAVSGQGFEVPLEGLAPGVYLLRVETERGWAAKKLVVAAH